MKKQYLFQCDTFDHNNREGENGIKTEECKAEIIVNSLVGVNEFLNKMMGTLPNHYKLQIENFEDLIQTGQTEICYKVNYTQEVTYNSIRIIITVI
jgi:hypothetical protein